MGLLWCCCGGVGVCLVYCFSCCRLSLGFRFSCLGVWGGFVVWVCVFMGVLYCLFCWVVWVVYLFSLLFGFVIGELVVLF